MKNAKKWLGALLVAMLVVAFVVGLVACDPKKGGNLDNEKDSFSMSIQAPDGVFNPFFSTSAYDSSIISMTQISMFNTDNKGNLIAGLDQPTVALAFRQQALNSSKEPTTDDIAAQNGYTDYEILIKNGIKFSDGTPLTIKDVLFNLYVYLDPVYTGSATIYSTDIVGLNAYRTQQEDLDEEGMSRFEESFYTGANNYRDDLLAWVLKYTGASDDDYTPKSEWNNKNWDDSKFSYEMDQGFGAPVEVTFGELANKVNLVASLYYDELLSDWNSINMEDYKKPEWPGFTEPWQVFLLNDMGMTDILLTDDANHLIQTNDMTYCLDVNKANEQYKSIIDEYQGGAINSMPEGQAKQDAIRDAFIESQFSSVFRTYDKTSGNYTVTVPSVHYDNFKQVITRWNTSATLMDELIAEVKTNYFKGSENEETGLNVPNITGITVKKVTSFEGKQSAADSNTHDILPANSEPHYVLKIRINKVDPKALMNFAFTVAPMHYYSNAGAEKDDQVKLVNEDWERWEKEGEKEDEFNRYVKHFGLKYADSDFMNKEINATSKIGKPLGAGVYQASNDKGEQDFYKVTDSGRETGFYDSNMIFYTRNTYFWTVGSDGNENESASKLHNAYIKKAVYKVVAQDQIISALSRGDILFGDPGATQENRTELERAGLTIVDTETAGYGYIGINPRYVPEHQVRQAIMWSMDIQGSMINDYYKGNLAQRITRPMSRTSWAYPQNVEAMYDFDDYVTINEKGQREADEDALGRKIRELVESAGYSGWSKPGDVYTKGTKKLEIKFTIAGGSTDHPAYNCFLNAQRILNKNGFNVQVVTSAQALSDLSAGKLAVWAAAWSSAIDPDMYQIYHINSQASSTSNWGYKQIKADRSTYNYEYNIIAGSGYDWSDNKSLSTLIEEARETTDQNERAEKYAICLDLVMALAVELPTYNRHDFAVYNPKYIDASSLPRHNSANAEVGPYYGLLSRIWEVKYA